MLQEVRVAIRKLRKEPGFTLVAVLTLTLGIGATTAVFNLIQGVLLTPPPFRDPHRLALVLSTRTDGKVLESPPAWPARQWLDWQKQAKSFDEIAAYGWTFNFLVRNDGSESMQGMVVTGNYFRTLGLKPALGRTFLDSEAAFPTKPVIILGYDLWQRTFHGDPNIIGKTIHMSRRDTPPTVIGVMPPGVRFLPSPEVAKEPNYNVDTQVDFWIPGAPNPARLKQLTWDIVARLRAGHTLKQGQQELAVLTSREAREEHDFANVTPQLQSLSAILNREGNRILLPLLGAAALVLLIACGNTAALLLVRGLQRQQEYAVRSALGISRLALFRQPATESLLLALLGGVSGAALAFALVKIFKLIGGHAIPRLDAVSTGWPLLACGLGAAIIAAVLAGIFPALRASRFDPIQVLKSAGPNSSASRAERRILRGVTVVQTALTLALLVGAGLLIRTMNNISQTPSGFNTGRILTLSVTAVQGDWLKFHRAALARVSAMPGVQAAAFAWGVPLTGNNWQAPVWIEGQPAAANASDQPAMPLRSVTPGYFHLLGLSVLDGRDFRDTDIQKAPDVAIINQAFADRYFPHQNPIGKKLWLGQRKDPADQVIGVVSNGRTDDLTEKAAPEIYLSLWQASAFSKHLVIRTAADPRLFVAAIQRELRAIDPTAAVEHAETLEQIRSDSLASRTFAMDLLVGFSLAGSVLTLVGIYGVLSLSVTSRRRELAIRSAIGAASGDIGKLVFSEVLRLIAGGIICGIGAAILLSRVLRTFLYGVEPTDPLTLVSVGLLFAAVACVACWGPIRRAVRVDPLDALRYE